MADATHGDPLGNRIRMSFQLPSESSSRVFEQLVIPDRWHNDPLLRERTYFTLPVRLWNLVVRRVGRDQFSVDDLDRERDLGQIVGDHAGYVGLRRGHWVPYAFLGPLKPVVIEPWAAEVLSLSPSNATAAAAELTKRLHFLEGPMRGYLGWFLTQRSFLDEHDALLERHRDRIRQAGFPFASS